MSLTDKVSNGLAVVIIQNFIPLDTDTCIKCRQYYRHVLLFACGGAALLGVFGIISMDLIQNVYHILLGQKAPKFGRFFEEPLGGDKSNYCNSNIIGMCHIIAGSGQNNIF